MKGGFFIRCAVSWFCNGLKFECKRCLHCCSGEPGLVLLSEASLSALCSYLGLDREDFLDRYTRLVDMGTYYNISLKEREDYSCIFLTEDGCSVYPVRPLQCRTYPFWDYLLSDRALWEAEKSSCPGIGQGPLHSEEEIRSQRNASLAEKLITILK